MKNKRLRQLQIWAAVCSVSLCVGSWAVPAYGDETGTSSWQSQSDAAGQDETSGDSWGWITGEDTDDTSKKTNTVSGSREHTSDAKSENNTKESAGQNNTEPGWIDAGATSGVAEQKKNTDGKKSSADSKKTTEDADSVEIADKDVKWLSDGDASAEAQKETEDLPEQTNEELIAQQHIVHVAPVENNFRFYRVDKKLAFAREEAAIREEKSKGSRPVGHLSADDAVFILQDAGDGWLYVESGEVRGFIRSSELRTGLDIREVLQKLSKKAEELAQSGVSVSSREELYHPASVLVPALENQAEFYTYASAYNHVVPKKAVLTSGTDINIREDKNTDARVIGKFSSGNLAYLLSDEKDGWYYIESGNVRGFIRSELVKTGDAVDAEVEQKGEDAYTHAEEVVEPSDNKALHYTLTSVMEGSESNPIRDAILKTAASCIGNPYVWGGTSLTNGADCSGFVQTLFAQYGITLPRVAEAQSVYGTQIPVSEAQPGDLIFFAKDGYVYHVALYAGNNRTIEAYGTDEGIIANNLDTVHAVWATRVISD